MAGRGGTSGAGEVGRGATGVDVGAGRLVGRPAWPVGRLDGAGPVEAVPPRWAAKSCSIALIRPAFGEEF